MGNVISNPDVLLKVLKNSDFADVLDRLGAVDNTTKELCIDKLAELSTKELNEIEAELNSIGYKTNCLVALLSFANYVTNLKLITSNFKIKESQLEKIPGNLAVDSELFKKNFEVLTEYGIAIVDENSRIEVNPLGMQTERLIRNLDTAIEVIGEEELEKNVGTLHINALPAKVYTERALDTKYTTSKGKYKPEIVDIIRISKEEKEGAIKLPSREDNNIALNSTLGVELVSDGNVELTSDQQIVKASVMQLLEEKGIAATKLTYLVGEYKFSKKKFERNLDMMIALNPDLTIDQVLFASLVYNSYLSDDEVKSVAETLGFSVAMGGR